MKNLIQTIFLLLLLAAAVFAQSGGSFTITQSVVAAGGGTSSGGAFTIESTTGQPLAGGLISNTPFNLFSGFWTPEMFGQTQTLQFSAATYTVGEGGSMVLITVTRTGGSDGAIGVSYSTTNGTASGSVSCIGGIDYLIQNGMLSWANADGTPKTFTIPICDDALLEGNETINLALSNATGGAVLGTPNTAVLTITDNDIMPTPTPTVTPTPTPTPTSTPTPTPTPTPTSMPTPTPTPGNTVCTPIITVTEGDLFPGGLNEFAVTGGSGIISIDPVNTGTGLHALSVVNSMNAMVNLPSFTVGTTNPVIVTFTVINSNLPVEINLRAAGRFHAVFIRAQCACTPTLNLMDDPSLPGGLNFFAVTTGANSVTVDHINSGTGLQVFQVVNQTNALVTIPPFMPGTFTPVTATYTIVNPALPVNITLRATSQFHGVIIRLRCGTPPPGETEN